MDTKHYALAGFEFKFLDEKAGTFEGYGSTFGNIDDGRDVVEKGAFTDTLAEHAKAGTWPAMFFSHDIHEPVGDWLHMEEDKKGLYCKGQLWLSRGIPKVEQTYMMLKGTGRKGLSIGYGIALNGASYDPKKQVRHLAKLDLWETSPTPFPMNRKATIVSVKAASAAITKFKNESGELLSKRDMEELLRDGGLSATEAKAFLAKGYAGLDPRDAELGELLKTIKKYTTQPA